MNESQNMHRGARGVGKTLAVEKRIEQHKKDGTKVTEAPSGTGGMMYTIRGSGSGSVFREHYLNHHKNQEPFRMIKLGDNDADAEYDTKTSADVLSPYSHNPVRGKGGIKYTSPEAKVKHEEWLNKNKGRTLYCTEEHNFDPNETPIHITRFSLVNMGAMNVYLDDGSIVCLFPDDVDFPKEVCNLFRHMLSVKEERGMFLSTKEEKV